MRFELSGVLYQKFDSVQRTSSFKVREFVLEHSEEINGKPIVNYIKFQCTQDRVSLLDNFNPGDKLKVTFSIRGSKWEKSGQISYFNNLDAWRIESLTEKPENPAGAGSTENPPPGENKEDDLPF